MDDIDEATEAIVEAVAPVDDDDNFEIPDYVCCVLTEGTWTWFGAFLLIFILFTIATLKYCKKYLTKTKFLSKNLSLLKKSLIEDDGDAQGKIRLTPVKIDDFIRYCNVRRKHAIIDTLEFDQTMAIEAKQRKNNKQGISFLFAHRNKGKNQNQDVVAQDGNRVKLEGQSNDYINATRLPGPNRGGYLDRSWIVTQGPMDSTVEDFWRLIWQEDTRLIVMLTKTFEVVRLMCTQYWPLHANSSGDKYGAFTVQLVKEDTYAHYKVRRLRIKHRPRRPQNDEKEDGDVKNEGVGNEVTREVTQFHYTSWPLSAKPDMTSLLQFRKLVVSHMDKTSQFGPPLIHCHDGGGRSGTYLAIEANLTMAEREDQVDILGTVKWLHKQRAQLVSNPTFYRLVYDVLEDYIKCGDTSLSLEELLLYENEDLRKAEFTTLGTLRPQYTIGDCAGGHRNENREKNRNVLVVPPDERRPYLTSFQGNDCTDYINAVFVDGFCQEKELIVTEWPLLSTVENYWSMIYDHECSSIVILNDPPIPGKVRRNNCLSRFWPETSDTALNYNPVFSVQLLEKVTNRGYNIFQLKLCKKDIAPHRKFHSMKMDEKKKKSKNNNKTDSVADMLLKNLEAPSKIVRLYQVTSWPQNSAVPTEPATLLEIMADISQFHNDVRENNFNNDTAGDHVSRVAVVSADGIKRVGIYCSAFYAFQQIVATKRVDIFSAVKCVRKARPQLVDNIDEYNFIHAIVRQFVNNITK